MCTAPTKPSRQRSKFHVDQNRSRTHSNMVAGALIDIPPDVLLPFRCHVHRHLHVRDLAILTRLSETSNAASVELVRVLSRGTHLMGSPSGDGFLSRFKDVVCFPGPTFAPQSADRIAFVAAAFLVVRREDLLHNGHENMSVDPWLALELDWNGCVPVVARFANAEKHRRFSNRRKRTRRR